MNNKTRPKHRRTLTTFIDNYNINQISNLENKNKDKNINKEKNSNKENKKVKNKKKLEIIIPNEKIDCLESNELFTKNESSKTKFSTLKSNKSKKLKKVNILQKKINLNNKSLIYSNKKKSENKKDNKIKKFKNKIKKRNTTVGEFNFSKFNNFPSFKGNQKVYKNNKQKINFEENDKELELKIDIISTEFINYQKDLLEIQKQNLILKEKIIKLENQKKIENSIINKIFKTIKTQKTKKRIDKENILKPNNNLMNISNNINNSNFKNIYLKPEKRMF